MYAAAKECAYRPRRLAAYYLPQLWLRVLANAAGRASRSQWGNLPLHRMRAEKTLMKLFDWHGQDSRATGPLDIAHAVTAQYGTGGNTPMVVHEQTICRANSQSHAGTMAECAPCLICANEAPILAHNCLNPQDNQSRRIAGPDQALASRETAGEDQKGIVSTNEVLHKYPKYIVRRLIPLECSRLQGFPDGWGEIAPLDIDNDAELEFWRGVYRTDCTLKNKRISPSVLSDPRKLARWHDSLHSISAEYRMWGNGMALPNALFFVRRTIDQIVAETGKTPTEIKLGSLFDGSGTMPLAAEMCGAKAVWASEVEPYPIAVTRTHLPYMKHLGSVIDIDGGEIEPVDIITFGSPCQDLSIAGKRAGLSGARSGLFMQAVRIIRGMLVASGGKYPRFAIWENVPGALSSNGGKDFETVIDELLLLARPDKLVRRCGRRWPNSAYHGNIAWRIVDAQYWGVPQRRRRIYLVTDFSRESAGMVAFERKGAPWRFDPRVPSGERVAALATDCYQWHDRMVAGKPAGGQLHDEDTSRM